VAKLPDETITQILTLQRELFECLDSCTATELWLFSRAGETAETIPELEELQNIKERLASSCSRLHNILLRVYQSQPIAPNDMLNLLYGSIETAQASLDAGIANLREIRRNWN
jgi:hypothetical protein